LSIGFIFGDWLRARKAAKKWRLCKWGRPAQLNPESCCLIPEAENDPAAEALARFLPYLEPGLRISGFSWTGHSIPARLTAGLALFVLFALLAFFASLITT
jgi:hypothetical protein